MTVLVNTDSILIKCLELGPWGTNAYIIVCRKTRRSAVVDAPADADKIIASLKGTKPAYILLTHNHRDHIGALAGLREMLGVPLAAHAQDSDKLASPPEILLNDGDALTLGELELNVRHTPGHTPGSLGFQVGKYLFTGDTLFPGGPGKTGSPEAFQQIVASITGKIFVLPDDTQVFPGHGTATVIKKAKEEFAVFSARRHVPGLCGDVLWLTS